MYSNSHKSGGSFATSLWIGLFPNAFHPDPSDRADPLSTVPDVAALLTRFPHCCYFQADLTQDGEADRLANAAWDALGGIDVLANNVGTFRAPPFLELTRAHFDFVFGLNVWPAVAVTRAVVARAVATKRGGRILFSTSLDGSRSEPAHTLYDASKGAIDALTRQLAVELAPYRPLTPTAHALPWGRG